jgi:glyoxylase-like metal-dependent hydrolase (beta-lactamase superfamily II)
MFRGLGEPIARRLAGVEPVVPDTVYDDAFDLDLGGRVVRLRATGRAHSRGDQVVSVPDAGVMFTGDLVEAGQFVIFPLNCCATGPGGAATRPWARRRSSRRSGP